MSKKDIRIGIAYLLVFLLCFCAPHWIIENAMTDEPMGIYAEEGRG